MGGAGSQKVRIGTDSVYMEIENDGSNYVQALTFSVPLSLSGLSLNGNTIRGVGAPTLNTDAANKQYVDTAVAGITPGMSQTDADARYVQLTGGTMTGQLMLSAAPTAALGAATKGYVDGAVAAAITGAIEGSY